MKPQIRAGKLRALGVSSAVRMPAAPEIPTIAETGLPGFEAGVWIMAVAPANTPREIVVRLHNEIKAIIAMQDVQRRIVSLGAIPIESPPPEQLRSFLKSEIERLGRLIEQAGLSGSQ
jgi:tripartite-type tricarboxylate transporter receptor subunit TctC